jgi:hypothetical protein
MNYDDVATINLLCKAAVNVFIEDWSADISATLIENLNTFTNEIRNASKIDDSLSELIISNAPEELSPMGELLKNNVESALSEFSESVSTEEKIAILKELIKDLI